ncbi:MAG: hypothetical protein Q8S73_27080 [Deltaproteobacteria bacterium]|nr:hypothetical protein [Myxococcales bacterium]MDP3217801.1 hypothetical protein [Deltaproteobacteria bacterium]
MAPWLAGAMLALPVVLVTSPPSCDFPQYELMVALLRGYGDPSIAPRALYALTLGNANQGFFALAWLLSLAMPAALACKLIVAASIAGLPVAAARLADHLGRSRWTAVLTAPLALGLLFRWGLLANLLGLVLFVWVLPALDRYTDAPSWRGAGVVGAAGVGVALAHSSAPFLLGPAALALALARGGSRWRFAWAAVAVAPAALLVAAQYALFRASADATFVASRAIVAGLRVRLSGLHVNAYGLMEAPLALALLGTFVAALGVISLGVDAPQGTSPLRRHRFSLAAFLLGAQYLIWPYSLGGTGLLYLRFLPPAMVLLAVSAPPAGPLVRHRLIVAVLAVAGVLTTLLGVAPAFRAAHEGYAALERITPRIARGSAVVGLNLAETPGALTIFNHAHAHVVALRGGRSHDEFASLPQMPVRFRPGMAWEASAYRLREPTDFIPEVDFRRFRYALVRVPDARTLARLPAAMGPSGRQIAVSGAWALFESQLPVLPLTAPDPPGVPAGIPAIGWRLRALAGARKPAAGADVAPGGPRRWPAAFPAR